LQICQKKFANLKHANLQKKIAFLRFANLHISNMQICKKIAFLRFANLKISNLQENAFLRFANLHISNLQICKKIGCLRYANLQKQIPNLKFAIFLQIGDLQALRFANLLNKMKIPNFQNLPLESCTFQLIVQLLPSKFWKFQISFFAK
jgi:uncharacterized protein YjbI with pentapeptide repeats